MNNKLQIITSLIILFIILGNQISYAISGSNSNSSFFKVNTEEISPNETLKISFDLNKIKYDNFKIVLNSNIDNSQIQTDNNIKLKEESDAVVIEIDKTKMNIESIEMSYLVPEETKANSNIQLSVKVIVEEIQENKANEEKIAKEEKEEQNSKKNKTEEKQETQNNNKNKGEEKQNDKESNTNENKENTEIKTTEKTILEESKNIRIIEKSETENKDDSKTDEVKQEEKDDTKTNDMKQEHQTNTEKESNNNKEENKEKNENTDNKQVESNTNKPSSSKNNNSKASTEKTNNNKSSSISTNKSTNTSSAQSNKIVETVTYKGSNNNYLKKLEVKGVELNTGFNKENTTYFVKVKDTSSLKITATSEESTAKVVVTGNDSIKEGTNKILIAVTAENGNIRYYRIFVNCETSD